MAEPRLVLALDAIDACLKDSLSPDAMRWAPDTRPLTNVELLRQAATEDPDTADSVPVYYHCNLQSEQTGEHCTWLAERLRLVQCVQHDTFALWLCSFHADLPAIDALCKVCQGPMVEASAGPDDAERLLVDALVSAGRTRVERDELRELYEAHLHRLIPARLRSLPPEVSALPEEERP